MTRLILFSCLTLAACTPTVASRGDMPDPDLVAKVQPGVTTREQVATTLGTPTQISTFDDKIWYYVGRETEQYSFFRPETIKQAAIEVDFDPQGVVAAIKRLNVDQAAADITPVARQTPTYGREETIMQELMGDLSHPRPNMGGGTTPTGNTQ